MALDIDFESVPGVAIGTFHGAAGLGEFMAAAEQIWQLRAAGEARILWDLLDAQFDLSANEVRRLSEYTRNKSPYENARMAFVVAEDLQFGLVRMFEAMRETDVLEVRVCRDRQQALAWLTGESG